MPVRADDSRSPHAQGVRNAGTCMANDRMHTERREANRTPLRSSHPSPTSRDCVRRFNSAAFADGRIQYRLPRLTTAQSAQKRCRKRTPNRALGCGLLRSRRPAWRLATALAREETPSLPLQRSLPAQAKQALPQLAQQAAQRNCLSRIDSVTQARLQATAMLVRAIWRARAWRAFPTLAAPPHLECAPRGGKHRTNSHLTRLC